MDELFEPQQPATSPPSTADLDRLLDDLGAVDHALRRLDDGTYGTCEACGATIDDEVLAASPTAVRCRACGPGGAPASA